MSAMIGLAMDLIGQNVAERRGKGKAFLTPNEKELLDKLGSVSEGDIVACATGLQGVGDLMAYREDDLIPDEANKVGMLITETTKSIIAAADVRERAEMYREHPVLEKAPWEEAKDAWLGAFIRNTSDKKQNKVISELSKEQQTSFIRYQLSEHSVEEQKAIIEEVMTSTEEKDKPEA